MVIARLGLSSQMEYSLSVPGRYDRLEQIAEFIERAGQEAGLDEVAIGRCQLAVDEACTNIIEHGYQGEDVGRIDIKCEAGNGELVITIADNAKPFDAREVPERELKTNIEDMQIGGLGLFFIRKVMDAVEFTTQDGSNKLVMTKKREASED
jgi:serine/threonine-protein kinase RsbW